MPRTGSQCRQGSLEESRGSNELPPKAIGDGLWLGAQSSRHSSKPVSFQRFHKDGQSKIYYRNGKNYTILPACTPGAQASGRFTGIQHSIDISPQRTAEIGFRKHNIPIVRSSQGTYNGGRRVKISHKSRIVKGMVRSSLAKLGSGRMNTSGNLEKDASPKHASTCLITEDSSTFNLPNLNLSLVAARTSQTSLLAEASKLLMSG